MGGKVDSVIINEKTKAIKQDTEAENGSFKIFHEFSSCKCMLKNWKFQSYKNDKRIVALSLPGFIIQVGVSSTTLNENEISWLTGAKQIELTLNGKKIFQSFPSRGKNYESP